MTRGLIPAAVWLMALGAASFGADRAPLVRDICVLNVGAGPADEAYVAAHTATRVGAELDRSGIAKDVRQLLASGRFSDVRVEVEALADGVRVIYRVSNKLKLAEPVRVVGAKRFRESKVRDWLELNVGDAVDDAILGARAQKVLAEYRKASYPSAAARWEITETDKAGALARVTFFVDERQPARIGRVTFTGNTAIPSGALRDALRRPPWWNVFRWFSRNRYDREKVEEARAEIRGLYLDKGYLDVDVAPPVVTQGEGGSLSLHFAIREGPSYRLGNLQIKGATLFPEGELRRTLPAESGAVASREALDGAVMALSDFYQSQGYLDTRVRPVLTPDPERGTLDVDLLITEGQLVHIRNILIRGNTRTRDKVIRREVLVLPGDVFNEVKVRQSERILSNLGYFSAVRSEALSADAPERRDLILEVEEKPTGQFMVGAGFSSVDKVTGFLELSQGNFDLRGWPTFTGGGQKLKLNTQFGSVRQDYGISFVEPWFLDRKLSLGVDLDRSSVDYTDYDIKRTGGGVTLAKPLRGPNRISLGYRLEKSVISDIADTNRYVYIDPPHDDYYFSAEENRTKSVLRLTLTHDTRNRPFIPTRGNLTHVYGSLAGGPLGFDTEIYGLGFSTAQYVPLWFGHVLSLRARWETVDAYGGMAEVPLSDRLFIGGGRTVRGYHYRELGPKVMPADPLAAGTRSYRPVGGESLLLGKADYTVPIIQAIRLAAFFDIGNVWRDPYQLDFGNLASSAGVGLRFDIPGFPIAIDRAWPVRRDNPITDTDAWVFWIGYEY